MKSLKVSSLFHWLYGAVMFLPILLLPVFMVYSHRHDIDSNSIQVQQKQIVDFNQLYDGSEDRSYVIDRYSIIYDSDTHVFDLHVNTLENTLSTGLLNARYNDVVLGHKYLGRVIGDTANLIMYDGVTARGVNTFISPTGSYLGLQLYIAASSTPFDSNFIYTLYDLTQMFGAGNEPTTLQQFNTLFPESYYDYTLSHKELIDGALVTYNDTDIMSQATYQLYNAVDKYFNISQFFGFENLWNFMLLNWFGGNFTIYLRIFWQLLTYWLVVSIAWLIFDLFMYVPKLAHRWLDRSAIE